MDWLRSVRATSWKSKFHTFPFFASRTLHCNAEILFHFQLTSLWKNFYWNIHFREETSLRASSPGRSGNRAAKGRRTCNSSLEFEYLHQNRQCKMLIGEDDISNDVITLGTCMFLNFWQNSCSFLLRADCQISDSSVDGEPQWNWRWNSNSRHIT